MSFPQPVPPSWKDLGKSANDLLAKEYPVDGVNLELKTTPPGNTSYRVVGLQDKSGQINAEIEGKYTDKPRGIALTQAWTTSNLLRTTLELDEQIAKGFKLEASTTLVPSKGSTGATVTTTFKQPGVSARAVLDVFKGPTITADTVFGRDGFLVGAEAAYNLTEGSITRYAGACGFSTPDYAVALHGLQNLTTFSASYYHRVTSDVEAGAKAIYNTKSTNKNVILEVGAKATLDRSSSVKARINSVGIAHLAYNQTLRPGVKASFGLALDTQRINESAPVTPVHKIGASFIFEY